MKSIKFLKRAITDYRVGAITISSRFVVRKVLASLPTDTKYVIEYGPGEGVITKAILEKLPKDGKLVAFETNAHFCEELRKNIKDSRFHVINDSIVKNSHDLAKIAGVPHVDAVVSGIPFTYIKPADREKVAAETSHAIRAGGRFVVYQYSLLMKPVLKRYFPKFRSKFEVRNFPPYFIMVAEK